MADFLDQKDLLYLIAGLGFFGLSALPMLVGRRPISIPMLYVIAGSLLALLPLGLPMIDPLSGGLQRSLVGHVAELIVIVALMGVGLAVDRRGGLFAWRHTWLLLGVTMPLTMLGAAGAAWAIAGLPLASAALLAAALAPTDPVLARSVQVGAPTLGEEDDFRVALTTESGLNDGLAFPFVHFAILLAGLGAASSPGSLSADLLSWVGFDVLYRIAAALAMGWLGGGLISRFVHSPYGDAYRGGENAALVVMGATFLLYGATEAINGYGFLAVFMGARAGREYVRGTTASEYLRRPHHFSDQIEKILLALLLLWLGAFAGSGLLAGTSWNEAAVAAAIVLVIRPLAGAVALWPASGSLMERGAMAVLGIRGFGTVFYVAYGQGHASFQDVSSVWRIAVICILLSIFVHGALAPIMIRRLAAEAED